MAPLSLCPGCLALAGDLLLPGQSLVLVASSPPALCSLQTQNPALQGALKSKGYQGSSSRFMDVETPTAHPASVSMQTGIQKPTHILAIGAIGKESLPASTTEPKLKGKSAGDNDRFILTHEVSWEPEGSDTPLGSRGRGLLCSSIHLCHILRQGLLNPEFRSLSGQQAPRTHLSLLSQFWGYRHTAPSF